MDSKDLRAEVRDFIQNALKNDKPVVVGWAVHEIMQAHGGIGGDDLPFYQICAYAHISELVKRGVNKYADAVTDDRQQVLEGFEHLQVAYPMDRSGERVLVPVSQCTDDEMLARADELDSMAVGCRTHAQEIRGFVETRSQVA